MKNRSRIALLIVVLFMLGAVSIAAYQSLSKIIILVDDGKVTQYETNANNVSELLEQLEITLGEKDTVTPSLDTIVEDGMKVDIERWKPTIHLTVNGEKTTFKTDAMTIEALLKEKNLQDKEGLEVEPELTTKITDNLDIIVKTKEIKKIVENRPVSFEVETRETSELKSGETKVVQEGKNGEKQVTVEKIYQGGELVSENVLEVKMLTEPVNKVVLKGKQVSKAVGNFEYAKVITMEATAYTDVAGDQWSGRTASGMPTFVGMVAVDPNVIPLGTKLYVEGYGLAIAGDTGGAIKGHKIDLFFNSADECYNFGRRDRKVYILKDQSIDVIAARQ